MERNDGAGMSTGGRDGVEMEHPYIPVHLEAEMGEDDYAVLECIDLTTMAQNGCFIRERPVDLMVFQEHK